MKRVVIFGGGTGLSCILSGLKLFPIDVTTVIAVSDKMCIRDRDEDVLSYALFPQVATDFFKYRQAQQEKVDMSQADTKNAAYPV